MKLVNFKFAILISIISFSLISLSTQNPLPEIEPSKEINFEEELSKLSREEAIKFGDLFFNAFINLNSVIARRNCINETIQNDDYFQHLCIRLLSELPHEFNNDLVYDVIDSLIKKESLTATQSQMLKYLEQIKNYAIKNYKEIEWSPRDIFEKKQDDIREGYLKMIVKDQKFVTLEPTEQKLNFCSALYPNDPTKERICIKRQLSNALEESLVIFITSNKESKKNNSFSEKFKASAEKNRSYFKEYFQLTDLDEKLNRWKSNSKTLESLHFDSDPKEEYVTDDHFFNIHAGYFKSSLLLCKKFYTNDSQQEASCRDAMFEWALDDLVRYLHTDSSRLRLIHVLKEPTTEARIAKLNELIEKN